MEAVGAEALGVPECMGLAQHAAAEEGGCSRRKGAPGLRWEPCGGGRGKGAGGRDGGSTGRGRCSLIRGRTLLAPEGWEDFT